MPCRNLILAAALLVPGLSAAPAMAAAVQHQVTTVQGVKVDRYKWQDSKGRPRTVSLKRQGNGNPGNGGYAVQMTYQVKKGNKWRTVVVNSPSNEGFGYFVSHERYRDFTDGDYNTVARKGFGKDDSPLGKKFPVKGKAISFSTNTRAAHRFSLTYPRYGTVNPIKKTADGEDVKKTPAAKSKLKLYELPVTITWYFEDGTDYPRVQTVVSLKKIPGPDLVNFDVRGPYGVMEFDDGQGSNIKSVSWGDRFLFQSEGSPLVRNSGWTWDESYDKGRFTALVAGGYEMGMFEPVRRSKSALVHGFAFGRGDTSDGYNCQDAGNKQVLPCDWEWPYQSAQYSLPYDNLNAPTNYKKIAWGSAPYYGSGSEMKRVWDSGTTSVPFVGFPANGKIDYSVCIVLGKTIGGGLTRAAAAGPHYNCAS